MGWFPLDLLLVHVMVDEGDTGICSRLGHVDIHVIPYITLCHPEPSAMSSRT